MLPRRSTLGAKYQVVWIIVPIMQCATREYRSGERGVCIDGTQAVHTTAWPGELVLIVRGHNTTKYPSPKGKHAGRISVLRRPSRSRVTTTPGPDKFLNSSSTGVLGEPRSGLSAFHFIQKLLRTYIILLTLLWDDRVRIHSTFYHSDCSRETTRS